MSEIAEFTRHLGNYLPPPDIALVERAFQFSDSAHRGQFRKSGEPYITHPLAVASILSQWRLDAQGLAAALLHDVMEDTAITKSEIETSFGKLVADMVDGLSKLDQIEFNSREDAQAESFRKMLLAMAQDVRVILIKLADRLHNMRTLDAMAPPHRRRIAHETLDIYAPIANRLGLNSLFLELQDLAFKHLYPMRFRILANAIKAARGNRREVMNRLLDVIRDGFAKAGITAVVSGREKTIYSVYKKMGEKRYTFSQVFDIYGVRVLVADTTACYAALGALHGLYKPIPGKFKDYIAIPKANGYQSLHTTLFGPFGTPLEAQIRTHEMHRIAETGVAAHWLYKSPGRGSISRRRSARRIAGCKACSRSSPSRATRRSFSRTSRATSFRTRSTCSRRRARSWRCRAGDRGRFRIRGAYRRRPPLRRGADQLRAHAAAHRAQERRPRRDPHLAFRPAESVMAVVRRHRQGALAHPPLPEGFAAEGVGGARRAVARPGAGHAQGRAETISWERWESLQKEFGAKSQLDILADIGLGKRLSFVVAQALTRPAGKPGSEAGAAATAQPSALTLRGVEGVAIQYAKCCRPIPRRPGGRPLQEGPRPRGAFEGLHHAAKTTRGRRAVRRRRLGSRTSRAYSTRAYGSWSPTAAGCWPTSPRRSRTRMGNIDNVSMERPDGDGLIAMFFSVQVKDRTPPRAHHARPEARRCGEAGPARADLAGIAERRRGHRGAEVDQTGCLARSCRSSPAWYISFRMSQPPMNSPLR